MARRPRAARAPRRAPDARASGPSCFERELRDLWTGGRGLVLCFAFSLLLSVIAYLVATNTDLNFLEQRESVSLTLQVAIAVGALLALLVAGDAISGERERGTLETMLLTPAPRRQIATGKLLAALSLWLAAFVVTVPYVWRLGRGVGIVGGGARRRPRRRHAARRLPRVARHRDQRVQRLQPLQPLAQPVRAARALRALAAALERGAGLGRRAAASASTRSPPGSTSSAGSSSTATPGARTSRGSCRPCSRP